MYGRGGDPGRTPLPHLLPPELGRTPGPGEAGAGQAASPAGGPGARGRGTRLPVEPVVDDRALSWPLAGAPITLINPQPNGGAGTSETYQVINNNYATARKTEGERTILAKKYLLITPVQM